MLRTLAESNYIAAGMEFFPAIDEEQFKFIKTVIDESDYYVAVVAGRYGSIAPDGLSYSEKEYEYALEKRIPVIALVRDDIDSIGLEKKESTPERAAMLHRFREKLITGRLAAYWKDETELCYRLVNSLARTSKKYPRDGWVKGAEDPEALLLRILELERTNKELQSQNSSLRDVSFIDHIRDQLVRRIVHIEYQWVDKDNSGMDASEELTGLEIALFVLPRLGFISKNKWQQVSEQVMLKALEALVTARTKRNKILISDKTVRDIGSMLAGFGLVSLAVREFGNQQVVMVSSPGFRLAKDELDRMFSETDALGKRVTITQILEDIGSLVASFLTRRKR
jgi:hypothetical protein